MGRGHGTVGWAWYASYLGRPLVPWLSCGWVGWLHVWSSGAPGAAGADTPVKLLVPALWGVSGECGVVGGGGPGPYGGMSIRGPSLKRHTRHV